MIQWDVKSINLVKKVLVDHFDVGKCDVTEREVNVHVEFGQRVFFM